MSDSPAALKHSLLDDVQGLGLGIFLCGIGVHVLTHVGLMTGQTAGLAVLISYATGWSFGAVFFVVNLPFYALAWKRFGAGFTVRSLISVSLLSLLSLYLPQAWQMGEISAWLGACVAGSTIGLGLMAMFRHRGSLGGFGVLALYIQDSTGFRAGYVQLLIDTVLFGIAFFMLPAAIVVWSLLGAVLVNGIIAVNHRPDRYVAR